MLGVLIMKDKKINRRQFLRSVGLGAAALAVPRSALAERVVKKP
ncbi:unnamed protein product, partial [marine sediment metagenome]